MVEICASKRFLLLNFWKLLFWIAIKYRGSRFVLAFGFDPHPMLGWKNNQKECPGFEFRKH